MSNDDIPAGQPERITDSTGRKRDVASEERDEWWFHLFSLWLFDENHLTHIMDYAKVLPFDEFLKRKREGWYTRNSE